MTGDASPSGWAVWLISFPALKQMAADADAWADMARGTGKARRHQWSAVAARWLELLWRCQCQYSNVATYRCYGCGSRPPRELRARVEARAAAASTPATPAQD